MTGIEAQEVSVALLRRSLAHNGISDRVVVHQGDMRSGVIPEGKTFDLITGVSAAAALNLTSTSNP